MSKNPFHENALKLLNQHWEDVLEHDINSNIDTYYAPVIKILLRSQIKSYRYVLPTQLLAKITNNNLNTCSLQAQSESPGSFDARSLAKHTIVPFERALRSPLGGSGDPYVNNPLRVPELSSEYREQQKNKEDWDSLCTLLEEVQQQNNPLFTKRLFKQTLLEIRRVCDEQDIEFLIPQRIDLERTMSLVTDFLAFRSGGARLQAVAFACFNTIAKTWSIFDAVNSGPITAADTPGDRVADIECVFNDEIVLAVEVKDTTLTIQMLEDKIERIRRHQVKELLFLIRAAPLASDDTVIIRANQEFNVGHNIYLVDADSFFFDILTLLGEAGRRTFLEKVGSAMRTLRLGFEHRNDWANLLRNI